jgi:hypothetical protein
MIRTYVCGMIDCTVLLAWCHRSGFRLDLGARCGTDLSFVLRGADAVILPRCHMSIRLLCFADSRSVLFVLACLREGCLACEHFTFSLLLHLFVFLVLGRQTGLDWIP